MQCAPALGEMLVRLLDEDEKISELCTPFRVHRPGLDHIEREVRKDGMDECEEHDHQLFINE